MKIIKIKVYPVASMARDSQSRIGSTVVLVDYLYCVYFLGVIIHSVTLKGLEQKVAHDMFGEKIQITALFR